MKQRIAIILARGGSKRLPRKNIIEFGGRPMIAWSVSAALDSGCFDRVLVSTDDEEVAAIGRRSGADVPFLRRAAYDDHATASEATVKALLQAEDHWGKQFNVVAQLMANCPLRTAGDIRTSIEAFEQGNAPSQISVFKFGWMNPWWAARLGPDAQPDYLFPEARHHRSQDLPDLYCPSGAIWLARRDALVAAGDFYMDGHGVKVIDWMSALDIDDDQDLDMARACLDLRNRRATS